MSVSFRNTGGNTVNSSQNQLDTEVETTNPSTPLMGDTNKTVKPTLATAETDEDDGDRDVVNSDRNFDNDNKELHSNRRRSSGSLTNSRGPDRNPMEHHNNNGITGNHFDENDGLHLRHHGHQLDIDLASVLEEIPDLNVYQHKKTLAQGMMDLALFSANANQLRYVLDSFDRHPYYYPSMIFITFSLILQVAIGVLLIWNATYNVKDEKEVCRANKINNYTVIGIFLVTVVNVFISAFGVADPPVTTLPRAANAT